MPAEKRRSARNDDWVAWIARLQPWYLLTRMPHHLAKSVFACISAGIAIGIISSAALVTGQPLLFPSLGPSAFVFFSQPTAATSCPRNAILSHTSGVLIGSATYWLFAVVVPLHSLVAQIAAATLSLALISAWMLVTRIAHPPAASTALIVALGYMIHWQELLALIVAIVLLTAECFAINRLSGIVYPLWSPLPDHGGTTLAVAALHTGTPVAHKDAYAEIADLLATRQKLPLSKTR